MAIRNTVINYYLTDDCFQCVLVAAVSKVPHVVNGELSEVPPSAVLAEAHAGHLTIWVTKLF